MRVFFEFFLLMCCFASVFLLALEIRRYIHIKKDTFLCNIQEMSRGKINIGNRTEQNKVEQRRERSKKRSERQEGKQKTQKEEKELERKNKE